MSDTKLHQRFPDEEYRSIVKKTLQLTENLLK
jgi:hypothetical protein